MARHQEGCRAEEVRHTRRSPTSKQSMNAVFRCLPIQNADAATVIVSCSQYVPIVCSGALRGAVCLKCVRLSFHVVATWRPNPKPKCYSHCAQVVGFVPTGWMYEMKKSDFPVRKKGSCQVRL